MLAAYVVTFFVGVVSGFARSTDIADAAFVAAGICGGLYGLFLATNFMGSAEYMSYRGKQRLQNPTRFRQPPMPFMTEIPVIRGFGVALAVLLPLILIAIALGGGA